MNVGNDNDRKEDNAAEEMTKSKEKTMIMAGGENVCLFIEYEDVMERWIPILISINDDDDDNNDNNSGKKKKIEALSKLREIWDKYLECPTLLDPYLSPMISKLANAALVFISKQQEEENNVCDPGSNVKYILSALYALSKVRGRKHLQKYLPHEVPHLELIFHTMQRYSSFSSNYHHDGSNKNQIISKSNNSIITDTEEYGTSQTWECVYTLFMWLGQLSLLPFPISTLDSNRTIITRKSDDKQNYYSQRLSLMESIVFYTKHHLQDAGPTRDAAASTLALWLSRTTPSQPKQTHDDINQYNNANVDGDDQAIYLQNFLQYSQQQLENYYHPKPKKHNDTRANTNNTNCREFEIMGILQTCAMLFQLHVHRNDLVQQIIGSKNYVSDDHNHDDDDDETFWVTLLKSYNQEKLCYDNVLMRKLFIKLIARIGCSHLPPRLAPWRYQRGRRSLLQNLSSSSTTTTRTTVTNQTTVTQQKHYSNINNGVDEDKEEKNDSELLWHVPYEVEDAMGELLYALSDGATIVRWSAAKGVGRLTERLPSVCADDVLDAVLASLNISSSSRASNNSDCGWHGACLALAELARRGLLLPRRLKQIIEQVVIPALQYDVKRNSNSSSSSSAHSIGAHVRDAACYTCWAFARAYSPADLLVHIPKLCQSMVMVCLFDREINCRRAASAAFQECVGRQGAQNIPHGIDILTKADYFSLGNRSDAYTTVAWSIVQLTINQTELYAIPILQHLIQIKLSHWDIQIRTLACQSLHKIVTIILSSHKTESSQYGYKYFVQTILAHQLLPKCIATEEHVHVRHGAILATAEVIIALHQFSNRSTQWNDEYSEVADQITNLVPEIEKKRMYRGRGGEIIRCACLRLIECLSLAKFPLTVRQQVRLLDSIDASLPYPNAQFQVVANASLKALLDSYFPVSSANGPSPRLQARIVDKYVNVVENQDNPAATRGFALALGQLPRRLLAPNKAVIDKILNCLSQAAHPQNLVGGEGDAETRKNAIQSIVKICGTVGIVANPDINTVYPCVQLDKAQISKIWTTLLEAMMDYKMDRRGDVGSWSRIEAMKGLVAVVKITVKASVDILQPTSTTITNVNDCLDDKSTTFGNKTYFNEEMCVQVIGVLLKQLSEKLDAVRQQAGECLEQLLLHDYIPFVPSRQLLVEALQLSDYSPINWSNSNATFPLVMKAINIGDFFKYIVSGIIISIGGLTESVHKSSSAALLEWMRGLQKLKSTNVIIKFSDVLLELFDEHSKDGRVILPLLKTLEILLSWGCLDCLLIKDDKNNDTCNFSKDLLTRLKKEVNKCTDFPRILTIFSVALGLIHSSTCQSSQTYVQKELFPFLMKFLVHRYPKIRLCCAEQLYIKLIEDPSVIHSFEGDMMRQRDPEKNLDEVISILSEVSWDQELEPPGNVRASRNLIADYLSIPLSENERRGPSQPCNKKNLMLIDEYQSYASLVHEAGR